MPTISGREVICMRYPQNETMKNVLKLVPETNIECRKWLKSERNIVAICETTISSLSDKTPLVVKREDNTVSILLTDDEIMSELNKLYRNKIGPTNVLSFTNGNNRVVGMSSVLGDIALSFTTIVKESTQLKIPFINHVKHLLVHGCLHLLGFNHETTKETQEMEALEIDILHCLGVPNPYDK